MTKTKEAEREKRDLSLKGGTNTRYASWSLCFAAA